MDGEQLRSIIEGLEQNGLLEGYTHLLTGYIASLSLLESISDVAAKLKRYNPNVVYYCDPVMGDQGRLYVSPDLVPAFRLKVVPLADLITPNQFEAEQLSGMTIHNLESAAEVCDILHGKGPATVVISSLDMYPGQVTLFASTRVVQDDGEAHKLTISVPRVQAYFTGTGDLLSSLLLGWQIRYPKQLRLALESTIAVLQSVLLKTVESNPEAAFVKDATPQDWAARELKLLQAASAFENPCIFHKAIPFTHR